MCRESEEGAVGLLIYYVLDSLVRHSAPNVPPRRGGFGQHISV